MASSSTHRASSSTTSISRNYDVFLSFRGSDTRRNFTDHLYTTLTASEFKLSEMMKNLRKEEILWCLNELVKIIERKSQKESMVLPIFYHVDPSDVRNQRGSFGDALAYHERKANQEKMEMIQKWRIALREAANLSGCHVNNQYETQVVKEIVDTIIRRLNHHPLSVGRNIVGIGVHLEKLKSLMNTKLNMVSVVGIYGIGGVGKTTIAKAIYNEISDQYDGRSFLRNIERDPKVIYLITARTSSWYPKGKNFKINNVDEGISMIKRCLTSNRVLVIFDDVDELVSCKSTIIITTRDKHVLAQYGADIQYEVSKLNKKEATELFSLWAFKQNHYADGLPLALKVLGASLFGKKISNWESALYMHDLIQQMGWEVIRQECPEDPEEGGTRAIEGLFLDRCKFNPSQLTTESFKEMNRLRLLKIHNPRRKLFLEDHLPRDFEFSSYELTYLHWDGYPLESLPLNFHAKNLVELLLRNSNIKQLWRGNKLHDKLRVIDLSYSVHLIRIPDFSSVPNLEILTLEGCVNLELLPRGIYKWKHLQTLSCNGCSKLERFPEIKGNMRELRVLDLSGTAIMDLPSSITHLNGLQTLLLEECSKLHKIPVHICHLSSLEVLDLGHCNIMEGGIPSDICHLSSLQKLNLERGHFSSIPTTINQLSGLEVLNLSHCNNLEQIPELPSGLRLLDAHGSNCTSSRAPFLPLHSLVNCFRAQGFFLPWQGTCIVLPGGDVIPKGIMDRTNRHFERTKLPQNWHQNNEFLGFAIFCVYVPLVDESEDIPEKESAHGSKNESDNKSGDESTRTWENETDDKSVAESFITGDKSVDEIVDFPFFQSNCFCYKEDKDEDNESVSGETLVPVFKNEKTMEVNWCGFHLIYSEDLHQSHPLTTQTKGADVRICNQCQCDGARRKLCFGCSDMNEVPIIENSLELDRLYILQDMESLRNLYLDRTTIKEIPSSIERLRGLQHLTLINCINLVNLPDSICNLTSLRKLSVESRIPDGISQLYNLTFLDLSHCKMLQHIPELPSGGDFCAGCKYRNVTAFIAESNGIPEWISHQKSGFKITMKLPWKTVTYGCFICKLNFDDDGEYFICERAQFCQCCYDDDASSQQCMMYYSKSYIPKRYHSNEWRTLNASFNVSYFDLKPVKVARCGFRFLYAHDYEQNNLTIVQRRSKQWLELLCKFVHWICCTRH
ncbi:hypothetical protein AAG906_017852 [Vitis piasezkii]